MPRHGTRQQRGYGEPYQRVRRALLASNPLCHWCALDGKQVPATTADHYPPIEVVGPHLNLLPACAPCNFGRRALREYRESKPVGVANPSRRW